MTTTFIAEDFPILEPGVYEATFDRIEQPDEPGQFGPYLNWFFTADTPEGPVDVMGRSSRPDRYTRFTKARQWHEAILGRELAKGESADPATLSGTEVSLTVDIVKTEKGDERNRIVSLRRKQNAESPSSAVDPDFEAYKAEQAAKKAAIDAANAEEPPTPAEPSSEEAA